MEHVLLPNGTRVSSPRFGLGTITGTRNEKIGLVTYTYYEVLFDTGGTHLINVRDTRALTAVHVTPAPEQQRAP
jgi:hypothetical protein